MGLLIAAAAPACHAADGIDDARSEARFVLRGAFGRRLEGRFAQMQAGLQPQGDGHWRATVWLPTGGAELSDHPRYTRIMRGDMFFDSARHPNIHFLSDPVAADWSPRGGVLEGELVIRGVSRREQVQVAPGRCASPRARDCVIEARGRVRRGDFGMHKFRGVVGEHVEFDLRVPMEPMS